MNNYVYIIDTSLTPVDSETILTNLNVTLLNRFDEPTELLSIWEVHLAGNKHAECELHVNLLLQFTYLDVREQDNDFYELLSQQLPEMTPGKIVDVLHSSEPFLRRQGLALVELNPQDYFIEAVLQMRHDPDPQVSYEAQRLAQLEAGLLRSENITPENLLHPDVDVHDRRQLLRWVLQTTQSSNEAIKALLLKALDDPDWEVRTSAIIAVARYDLKELIPQLVACDIRPGILVEKRDQEIVHAIKQLVLLILSGQAVQLPKKPGIKQQRWQRLYALVKGDSVEGMEYLSAFVYYFTHPQAGHLQAPENPPSIHARGDQYFLGNSTCEMLWIPPGQYILGDDTDPENPLRIQQLVQGFYISKYHYSENNEESLLLKSDQAIQKIQALSKQLSALLSIPTREQWEITMRGTDGRRYAWGWGKQLDWLLRLSPLGAAQCLSDEGEFCTHQNVFYRIGKINSKITDAQISCAKDTVNTLPFRIVLTPKMEQ